MVSYDIRFLVLDGAGGLHAYMNEQILAIDLAEHRRDGDPAVQVWRRTPGVLFMAFTPMNQDEIAQLGRKRVV